MKRLTYLLGYFLTTTWIVGVFFKLMQMPGADILLYGGGIGFVLIFIPFLIANRYKKIVSEVRSEKLKWIMGCISLSLFVVASIMQAYHLHGEALMMAFSFLFLILGFLPFFFFSMYSSSRK